MKRKSSYWVLGLLVIAFLAVHSDVALAASSESLVSQGTGIGGTFDKDFETIAKAFVAIAKVVVVIMTCVALGMVMWGVEDGKKTMWNWILGSWPGCKHRQLLAQCLHHAGCLQLWRSRYTIRAGSQEFQ